MFVGVSQIELFIPESGSLKSKRFVLNSIKTKIRNKFNVSVAEIGNNEKWQRSTLAVSTISNDRKITDSTIHKVIHFVESDFRVELVDYTIEIF
ncbi:MAG TPA: DUF503 domain-containing protein [bacterium]|nr:DUF503 domain-containing protein [bacterium]HDQ00510.1 DUF503 domain-containing protein [bacterium]